MIPEAPVLVAGLADAVWLSADGEIAEISLKEAARRADDRRAILCHAPAVARRLDIARFPCFDVLELFAFVRPAAFCVPTVDGIAEVLDLAPPADATVRATTLLTAASALLRELALRPRDRDDLPVAWAMARGGWSWGSTRRRRRSSSRPAWRSERWRCGAGCGNGAMPSGWRRRTSRRCSPRCWRARRSCCASRKLSSSKCHTTTSSR